MVHALRECWRVTRAGATLVDLRPVHSNPVVEVLGAGEVAAPGRIVDEGGAADDAAANRALAEMVRRRYFSPRKQDFFHFNYYWETLEDLLAYADERWRDCAYVPSGVARRARRAVAAAGGERCRIRIRRKIRLAVYRRRPPPQRR